MPRYSIPSTNRSFNNDLNPAFQTYNLGTMGFRIWPREISGGTSVSELVPSSFLYRLPDLRMYNIDAFSPTTSDGDVEYTSPFSLGPSPIVSPGVSYIVNDNTFSSITINCTTDFGISFREWRSGFGRFGTVIGTSATLTIALSNSNVYNAGSNTLTALVESSFGGFDPIFPSPF